MKCQALISGKDNISFVCCLLMLQRDCQRFRKNIYLRGLDPLSGETTVNYFHHLLKRGLL